MARIDVAADYSAEPRWLVLHRPFATTGGVVESKDWQVTQYAGGLGQDAELGAKLYDYARHHKVAGPVARFEVRRNFRAHILPRQLDDEPSPFRNLELCDLSCPDLSVVEVALLSFARDHGICWALKHLDRDAPADAKRLREAIAKAEASPTLESPKAIMEWMWPYLRALLHMQLFWHEVEPDDLQPWSYPPLLDDDTGSPSSPVAAPE